jgi:hypothetical protein
MPSEPIPATPPALRTPHPLDQYTWGSKVWAVLCSSALALEAYGLWYDKRHPGNRQKWTLTSNARTWFGWDSITGEPLDVPYGSLRRSALVMFLAWLTNHWTRHRGTF